MVKKARAALLRNLPEIARELLVWHRTGKLVDGKFLAVAGTLKRSEPDDYIPTAERLAHVAALQAVADAERRIAAAICNARVKAAPDGCGGGSIGFHAIGEPGGCPECMKEAREALLGKT